jgi:hypothetical protein
MKMFRATNIVLGLLCLMYFLTYLDRVNISAAPRGSASARGAFNTWSNFP